MRDQGVSQRELARRMAEADGTGWESKRRWLHKLLNGDLQAPEQRSLDAVAHALGMGDGTFTAPTRRQAAARRATLEEEVADLRGATAALLQVIQLLREQVEALGGSVPAAELEAAVRAVLHTQAGARGK